MARVLGPGPGAQLLVEDLTRAGQGGGACAVNDNSTEEGDVVDSIGRGGAVDVQLHARQDGPDVGEAASQLAPALGPNEGRAIDSDRGRPRTLQPG